MSQIQQEACMPASDTAPSICAGISKLHRQVVSCYIAHLSSPPSLSQSSTTETQGTSSIKLRQHVQLKTFWSGGPTIWEIEKWEGNSTYSPRDGAISWRCLQDRLGSVLQRRFHGRLLVSRRGNSSYRCTGIDCRSASLFQEQAGDFSALEVGICCRCGIFQQEGEGWGEGESLLLTQLVKELWQWYPHRHIHLRTYLGDWTSRPIFFHATCETYLTWILTNSTLGPLDIDLLKPDSLLTFHVLSAGAQIQWQQQQMLFSRIEADL